MTIFAVDDEPKALRVLCRAIAEAAPGRDIMLAHTSPIVVGAAWAPPEGASPASDASLEKHTYLVDILPQSDP